MENRNTTVGIKWFRLGLEIDSLKSKLNQLEYEKNIAEKEMNVGVRYSGNSYFKNQDGSIDGDSGRGWWVFPASKTDDEIFQALKELGVVEDMDRGVWDDHDWDCSGQTLVHSATIDKRTKTRVLVTQTWCVDV